jgi:hypothetical protein
MAHWVTLDSSFWGAGCLTIIDTEGGVDKMRSRVRDWERQTCAVGSGQGGDQRGAVVEGQLSLEPEQR